MEENINPAQKKGSKMGLILLISVVILLIAGALWYSFAKANGNTNNANTNVAMNGNTNTVVNSNSNTNAQVNSNTNSSTNTNSTVDTSDWLTYTNEKHNFSLQFPVDWGFIREFDGSFNPDIVNSNNTADSFLAGKKEVGSMLVFTFGSNKTINDVLNEDHITSEGSSKFVLSSAKSVLSSGVTAVIAKYDPMIKGYDTEYLFEIKSGVIAIGLLIESEETLRVINTFQFVDGL
ncbi:MAG: hypothetical protein WC693_02620 [Patescibacteria group bacterium]|jgi:hypothetical protein